MKLYLSLLCGVLLLSAESVSLAQNFGVASGSSTTHAASAVVAGTAATPQTNLPAAVHTSRRAFRIPYQYDPHEISRLGAREIRLFVSYDRGTTWSHSQSVQPATGRFDFRAPADGEFWFTVQTVDRNGQLHPGGQTLHPGLIVIVDSVKPTIEFDLREAAPGRVALDWTIIDGAVDPQSIVLEYTQSGQTDWQKLGVTPSATGTTTWSVPAGGLVAVRGRARDRAGNEAQSQFQIQVNPVSATPQTTTPIPGNTVAGIPAFGQPAAQPLPAPGASPQSMPLVPPGSPAPLPAMGLPTQSFAGPATPTVPSSVPHLGTAPVRTAPAPYTPPPFAGPQATAGVPSTSSNGLPPGTAPQPRWNEQLVSTVPGSIGTNEVPTFQDQQEAVGSRIVRERSFKIDYRVDDIGPSGVGAIELYVTQNGGEKWYRYGVDEDRKSPFDVEVPMDGVFGFSIRVVSGAGLSDPPPRSGEEPDIVIEVDASPPVVELHPLRQGTGDKRNRILITWAAEDQRLADQPIAISYATTPGGPWTQITNWRENTGEYIWTVNAEIPPRLYVRIVARDAAGNIAKVDTPQPVLVDISKPTARIVNVDPGRTRRSGNF
ncbi:MAG: hypothetical protein ACYTGL_28740 [Planctomycetota bacterium]|jgi:hypothetical protein